MKKNDSTRWNLSLIVIEKLIAIKNALSAAITSLRLAPNGLIAAEWDLIADYTSILELFDHMTSELSGEKYPTLSRVLPLIRGLHHTVKYMQLGDPVQVYYKKHH